MIFFWIITVITLFINPALGVVFLIISIIWGIIDFKAFDYKMKQEAKKYYNNRNNY